MELATSVKPFAIMHFFETLDCKAVLFFDPDIVLFSRLDDLISYFEEASLILTPHLTTPETELEAIIDNEISALKHGVYNLGFIDVKNDPIGRNFVKWWAMRLQYFYLAEPEHGLWVDQKWVDLVPALFEKVKIVKDSRFNVAPWNISQRKLSGSLEKGIFVDGKFLGFYHFTGWDSGAHKVMAYKYASGNKTLRDLIIWYDRKIKQFEGAKVERLEGQERFDNGTPVKEIYKRIYKKRPDLQVAFPDPFVTEGKSFYKWIKTQGWLEEPELIESEKFKTFFEPILRHNLTRRLIRALLKPKRAARTIYNTLRRLTW